MNSLGSEYRVWLLTITFIISFFSYWFFALTVFIPEHCDGFADYWLYGDNLFSPFWLFSYVFILIFIWALVEGLVTIIDKSDLLFRSSVLSVMFVFLGLFAAGQYTLWQTLEISRGKVSVDDYVFESFVLKMKNMPKYNNGLSQREYVRQELCKSGKQIYNAAKNEKQVIAEKYEKLMFEFYDSQRKKNKSEQSAEQ